MDDAYLNYYADRFIALRLSAYAIGLEQYLDNPAQFEHLADDPEPLLPAQQEAAARITAQWDADDEDWQVRGAI